MSSAQPSDRSFAAGQQFLLGIKTFWTQELFPALEDEYSRLTSNDHDGSIPPALEASTLHQFYAWFERHLQRMKYSGRYGLQPWHERDREELEAELAANEGSPELSPALVMPRYYTAIDIHQHPGGVWSDPLAGLVYERGARSTTPLAGARHRDLHDRFTSRALSGLSSPLRVLDMACGFGKSTRPFAAALQDARIDAIDLSAPCLQVAARDSARAGLRNVRYRQIDARHTDYPEGSFDLLTSTMFLHELPPTEINQMLDEAARLLRPGGRMIHLDFLPQVQPRARGNKAAFARFIHYGHAQRNNEPFMRPLAELDLDKLIRSRGFADVVIEPFAEFDGALDLNYRPWRFPWAVVSARRV